MWGIRIHVSFLALWIAEVAMTAVHYHFLQYTVIVFLLYGPILFETVIIVSVGWAQTSQANNGTCQLGTHKYELCG